MKKCFNNVQIFNSSDDCDKYSKNVSYETLVIGAATTGTGYKQIRRLFLSSANKPLSAVGTLTSLLCNSAKAVEKLLQMSHVLRLVKIFGLVTVLSFTIITESSAECVGATETTAGTDTITGAHCGICGTNCNWKIDGDTLKVTGGANGEIGHMNAGAKTIDGKYTYIMPWKGLFNKFSKVDISGVENVGQAAFRGFTNITDIKLDDSISKIGKYAFAGSQVKTIILPDSLKTLEFRAFSDGYTNTLEEVVLPDTLLPITGDSHFGDNPEQLSNLKIICLGDTQKCQNALANYVYWELDGERGIPFSLAGNVRAADYKYCNTTNYFWDGSTCIREPDLSKRKCCSSCKDVGGYCNRIRYTPAEAAPLLNDEDNFVILTFKK